MTKPKPGIYKHYKGGKYRVLATSTLSAEGKFDGITMVEYLSFVDGRKYVTAEKRFCETVDANAGDPTANCLCDARGQDSCRKHPGDPKMVPRFALLQEILP